MNYHPICYFIGRWEGQDFHYVAEVNTRELAEKVAEITGREILSDDDADPVEHFIRDYGNQESDDMAAKGTEPVAAERQQGGTPMEDNMEEAVKGWIACAMEIHGYAPYEIRDILEAAYRYQHSKDSISAEDAVNKYQYYRPTQETRLLAAREAAV